MHNKNFSTVIGSSVLFSAISMLMMAPAQANPTSDNILCNETLVEGYISCSGAFLGENDSNSDRFELGGEFAEWTFLDKVDNSVGGNGFNDILNYELTPGEDNQGTWNIFDTDKLLAGLGGQEGDQFEIGIVIKSGANDNGGFSFYNWGDQTSGEWDTFGTTDKGKQISHISLYAKLIEKNKVRVPEPGSIAALAFIGGGMFLSRRRKSH